MADGLAVALADYVEERFRDGQGLVFEDTGALGAEARDRIRAGLRPAVERIEQDWFSRFQTDDPVDELDPWWTRAEQSVVRDLVEGVGATDGTIVQKAFWPGGQRYAVVVTHDVDLLHPEVVFSTRRLAAHWRHRYATLTGHRLCMRDFQKVTSLDRHWSIPSTFFVRTRYDCIRARDYRRLMRQVQDQGFEIGLHATPDSAQRMRTLRDEIEWLEAVLGQRVRGVRIHRLSFSPATTWGLQESAGLEYDSTFSRNRGVGFPSGSTFPFRTFDASSRRSLGLMELPLAFMDWTGLQGDRRPGMRSLLEAVIGVVRSFCGVLVVDFHNTYLSNHTHPDCLAAYRWLVDTLVRDRPWMARAHDLLSWWRARAEASVTVHRETSHIVVRNPSGIPLAISSSSDSGPRLVRDAVVRLDELV